MVSTTASLCLVLVSTLSQYVSQAVATKGHPYFGKPFFDKNGDCIEGRFLCAKHIPNSKFPSWILPEERRDKSLVFQCRENEELGGLELYPYHRCHYTDKPLDLQNRDLDYHCQILDHNAERFMCVDWVKGSKTEEEIEREIKRQNRSWLELARDHIFGNG